MRGTPSGAILATNRSVIAIMAAISATTPTRRSHQRNNELGVDDSDVRVQVPIQFDLRSLQELRNYKYYIALASRGLATDCYLLDIVATAEAL
jgi:hypothetical protein